MVKYRRGHRSKNVEYRGSAGGRGGGRAGIPMGKAGAGAGGLGIIGIIIALLFGGGLGGGGGSAFDVGGSLDGLDSAPASSGPVAPRNDFLEAMIDDVQATWTSIFESSNQSYEEAKMVIFIDSVNTGGCGPATSAVGPFYCPADSKVYLDQAFLDELGERFGAPGDFAQAYVVAHELGHHVQNVLGVSSSVRSLQQQNPGDANELSVRLELQADCFAGVWGASAEERGILDRGDLEEGPAAAAAVGDERLSGTNNPESWTHGSSAQRTEWFLVGFDSGDPSACDTFEADNL